MKIDRIETIHLKFDYPNREGFRYGGGVCNGRLASLIAVHTNTGAVGYGSAYSHPILVDVVVKQQLEPRLIGTDPREVESLWNQMYGITRWFGRKGAAMTALGGLDTAFWDLRAQSLGKPLWALLGAKEGICPIYASGLLWNTPDELATEAARHIANGFTRVKMRVARGYDMDRAAVSAVRDAIGPAHDLMVDGSMRYSLDEAKEFGAFLAEKRVFWFEEPFPPEDLASFKALRGTIGVRLAAGENEFGVQGFRELIDGKCVDIVQPDASRCGGVSETFKVARLAGQHGLGVASHSWSDAVAIIANAHVVASVENGITVEMDQTGNPLVEQLLVEPIRVKDGRMQLGSAPGLGIELSKRVIDQYRYDPYTELTDGQYSDMAFGRGMFEAAPAR
jgi:L-alanine-DL-glutamate epimerase-like enolase superfamily enzyme